MTLISTNLRIFGPVTGLFLVGLVVDLNLGTRPLGMAIGAGLGIGVGGILVYRQFKNIQNERVHGGGRDENKRNYDDDGDKEQIDGN